MLQLIIKILVIPVGVSLFFLLIIDTFTILQGREEHQNGAAAIKLPAPDNKGFMPLEASLQQRRSVRSFQGASLSKPEVSQILWAAQGITAGDGFRTAPSAGALYPLETYLIAKKVEGLEEGIYQYIPDGHALKLIVAGDYLQVLSKAALRQDAVKNAPAVFVIAGIQHRTTDKYGARGVRYMHMEAGHAAQNICLQAVALNLGSVPIGAFSDRDVARIVRMQLGATPLYIIPVGKPHY